MGSAHQPGRQARTNNFSAKRRRLALRPAPRTAARLAWGTIAPKRSLGGVDGSSLETQCDRCRGHRAGRVLSAGGGGNRRRPAFQSAGRPSRGGGIPGGGCRAGGHGGNRPPLSAGKPGGDLPVAAPGPRGDLSAFCLRRARARGGARPEPRCGHRSGGVDEPRRDRGDRGPPPEPAHPAMHPGLPGWAALSPGPDSSLFCLMRWGLAGLLLAFCCPAGAQEHALLCYDYACKVQEDITYGPMQLEPVRVALLSTQDAAEEREVLALEVGRLYRWAGTVAPLHNDRPGDLADGEEEGRMDCIDHATSTTELLRMLERRGWLCFHRIVEPVRRTNWIFEHYSAAVEELAEGYELPPLRYVMDSWFVEHGAPAVVLPLSEWLDGGGPKVP